MLLAMLCRSTLIVAIVDYRDDKSGTTQHGEKQRKEALKLNSYEAQIAMEVVAPEDIRVTFDGKRDLVRID